VRSGDKEVLTAAGIECLVDEPAVGTNLQDHPCGFTTWQLVDGHKSLNSLYDSKERAKHQKVYTATQKAHWLKLQPAWVSCPTPNSSPQSSPRNDRQHPKHPNQPPFQRNNPSKSSPNSPIPPPPASKLFSCLLLAASNRASPTNSKPSLLYLQALPTVSVSSYTPSTPLPRHCAHHLRRPACPTRHQPGLPDPPRRHLPPHDCLHLLRPPHAVLTRRGQSPNDLRRPRTWISRYVKRRRKRSGAQHNILPSVQDVCTGQIVDVRLRVKGLEAASVRCSIFRGELADCLCSCGEGADRVKEDSRRL
jgi:hypothetical protein